MHNNFLRNLKKIKQEQLAEIIGMETTDVTICSEYNQASFKKEFRLYHYPAYTILFAILKLRPMPFCVLDEVEAALDEANVDRFAQYLKKFSDGTQFIVITHKKPTMEHSNALFGVTMQEKGVSRLVSVKLSDVAEITGDSSLA